MTLKRLGLGFFRLALASGLALSVRAQEAGPGAKAGTEAINTLSILGTPEAKVDLGLTPEQVAALNALRTDHFNASKEKLRPLEGLTPAEKMEKGEPIWQELADDANGRLSEILDADQQKRLKQIMLQMRGYAALVDPEVQAALGFGEEQKEKAAAIRDGLQKEVRESLAANEDRRAAGVRLLKSRDKAFADMMSLLTEDQKTLWSDLIGKEFKRAAGGAPARPPAP